ncbi:uncharacterized protein FIESC28_00771 [Fusarium coffeatum]|uniref:LTD domain-containing protein n=1 Tax=Fusarium coffeatum TaxID=231269 RepID=A0A366SAX2_9HYPO|nr:uncharacterized protein FIESC28_00771 [Fusarium coffeatum]RBR26477.1 hypothetical protein FIESC28_00771 [Fusarium coffeatum]
MVVESYGVWRAKPVRYTFEDRDDDPKTPHLSLFFDDDRGKEGRAAVNIKSGNRNESRLAYWTVSDFTHGVTQKLVQLSNGFHLLAGTLEQSLDGLALDYIRSNLFNRANGRILPHDIDGADNDILDQLKPIIDKAISAQATVYVYGSEFSRGKGIHNDGGLIFEFEDHWEAVFIGFASQAVHTRDGPKRAGHPLPDQDFRIWANFLAPERPDAEKEEDDIEDSPVFIAEALVNPSGPDQQPGTSPETITLKNRTQHEIDLSGWKIRIKTGDTQILDGQRIGPNGTLTIQTTVPLSNRGGIVTLLNGDGLRVHGVSYTQAQANGAVIIF